MTAIKGQHVLRREADTMEKPYGRPHLAFPVRRGRRQRRDPIPTQTVPVTARKGASVTSEAILAWALADAVSVCFTAKDQLGIYTTLGAGENYSAIDRMLDIAVRKRYPLPATLINTLAAWLDCYIGNEHEPTTRSLLNRVEPQALPTTAPPPRGRSRNPSITFSAADHRGTRHVAPEGPS
jgi:hypothetical protein